MERAPKGTALYVHLPFCEAKCHYCDFFSVPAEGQDITGTVDAVLHEIALRAPQHPRTVFIGGGTPSLLETPMLRRFLVGLNEVTNFKSSAQEVTLECNPESLDRDKASMMLDHGVRRLSIGFQSLEPETLQLFGRVHDVDSSFRAYEAARDAGIEDVNIDMIYAAPGNDLQRWRTALQRILDLEPDHLSAYNLAFEEDTVFSRWLRDGKLHALPEEVELEMFHTTRAMTRDAGLDAYEISNYGRAGRECRHNLNYWANGDYVGVGPSAVSYVRHYRMGNAKGIDGYIKSIAKSGHSMAWEEQLSPRARLGETWWLGLRRSMGVDPEEARRTAGFDSEPNPALETARRMVELNLLHAVGGRFVLTESGIPVADRVASEFLEAAEHSDPSPGDPGQPPTAKGA